MEKKNKVYLLRSKGFFYLAVANKLSGFPEGIDTQDKFALIAGTRKRGYSRQRRYYSVSSRPVRPVNLLRRQSWVFRVLSCWNICNDGVQSQRRLPKPSIERLNSLLEYNSDATPYSRSWEFSSFNRIGYRFCWLAYVPRSMLHYHLGCC